MLTWPICPYTMGGMAKITRNKDGSPRKSGSGRKAGSSSFLDVSLKQLMLIAEEKDAIQVGRKWYEKTVIEQMKANSDMNIVDLAPKKGDNAAAVEEKIAFKLTTHK